MSCKTWLFQSSKFFAYLVLLVHPPDEIWVTGCPLCWTERWVCTRLRDARRRCGFHSRYAAHNCDRNVPAKACRTGDTTSHSYLEKSHCRKGPNPYPETTSEPLLRAKQGRFAKKMVAGSASRCPKTCTPYRKLKALQNDIMSAEGPAPQAQAVSFLPPLSPKVRFVRVARYESIRIPRHKNHWDIQFERFMFHHGLNFPMSHARS